MKHKNLQTENEIETFINSLNSKADKVKLYPRRANNGVSIYFEFYDIHGRQRMAAKKIALLFQTHISTNYVLPVETNTTINKANSLTLEYANDLKMLIASTLTKNGKLPTAKELQRKDSRLFDYIEKINIEQTPKGKPLNRTGKHQLLTHLKAANLSNLLLNEIDEVFCKRFFAYLIENNNLKPASKFSIASHFNSVLNRAVRERLIHANPSALLEKAYKPKPPQFDNSKHLSAVDVQKLFEYWCNLPRPKSTAQINYFNTLRAFLFACYTGLRISDIEQLTAANITTNNGRKTLYKTTQKTKTPLCIPLNENAVLLLERFCSANEFLCPVPSREAIGRLIKKAFAAVGINTHFAPSMHLARHTFATLLANNGVDVQSIQHLLGHSTPQMSFKYAAMTPQRLENAISKIDW